MKHYETYDNKSRQSSYKMTLLTLTPINDRINSYWLKEEKTVL